MKVWIVCFLLLFALAELFDWMEQFKLPLPIYILGGAFLAVASNHDKLFGYYLQQDATLEEEIIAQPQIDTTPQKSISFTIKRNSEETKQIEPK